MDNVYCVKDRRVTPNVKSTARIVWTKNNHKMLKVKCAVCGITKTQFKKKTNTGSCMQIQACLHRHEEYLNFTLSVTGSFFFAPSIASMIKNVMSLSSFYQEGVQSSVMT